MPFATRVRVIHPTTPLNHRGYSVRFSPEETEDCWWFIGYLRELQRANFADAAWPCAECIIVDGNNVEVSDFLCYDA
jgi:hypothetical protein